MEDQEDPIPANTVTTSLWYLCRLPLYTRQKPYFINFPVTPNVVDDAPLQHNLLHERIGGIEMTDIRGRESSFSLDTNGFELVHHDTSLTNEDFENDQVVRAKYYPEMIAFVSKLLDAAHVVPFEHTHRLSTPLSKACGCDRKRKPLVAAHVDYVSFTHSFTLKDQTPASSAQRIRYHMGEEAPSLLQKRFQVIK
ncbi:hypothetical protein QQX98_000386 [Neonectria punicea]|uniref:Uncharacterized protein n=1 Tax=Neonectria punicea TaxID=979145 RepID=A0ABR1HTL4_9HYPO